MGIAVIGAQQENGRRRNRRTWRMVAGEWVAGDVRTARRYPDRRGGLALPAWRGHFHPAGLPPSRELAHVASRFRTVAVNGTFDRLQRPETFAGWADAVPDGRRNLRRPRPGHPAAARRLRRFRQYRPAARARGCPGAGRHGRRRSTGGYFSPSQKRMMRWQASRSVSVAVA
ncbi:DUF72 domain-containing protein [Stella sp.]|uniref:DUF72 domain-containing protein n=1 Tax=Stella sp. TaxID=2912054 RepID=UPI0035AED535